MEGRNLNLAKMESQVKCMKKSLTNEAGLAPNKLTFVGSLRHFCTTTLANSSSYEKRIQIATEWSIGKRMVGWKTDGENKKRDRTNGGKGTISHNLATF